MTSDLGFFAIFFDYCEKFEALVASLLMTSILKACFTKRTGCYATDMT